MKNDKKILICSGGTGGHVLPAINFGNYLISKGYICSIILDRRGLKYKNNFKGKIFSIQSSHLSGNFFFKIRSIIKLSIGFFQSIFYLIIIRPRHCISFGSYASFLPVLVCTIFKIFQKIDIHIHEQNSFMGRVNLLFLSNAKNIFINFKNTENIEKKYLYKTYYVGLPNLLKIKASIKQSKNNNDNNKKITIFIYSGSQGSVSMTKCLLLMFSELTIKEAEKIKIIIQSPNELKEKVKKALKNINVEFVIKDFYHDIHEILEVTDIAITRSGAGTINDLIYYKIPSILFPLPSAVNNHQIKNAQYLQNKQCAIIINENKFDKKNSLEIFRNLIEDSQKRQIMKNYLNKILIPNANKLMLKVLQDENK